MKRIFTLLSCVLFSTVIFAQVDLSELSQTNMATLSDEDGDFSDWLEIRNNGATSVNIEGYGITNDPLEPFKWVMPSYDLAPGEHKLIWASGKNRFPVIDHFETVIAANDVWSYIVPTSEPNASWRSPGATGLVGWITAIGGIGSGDNDDGTTIASPTSVFLRKTFNITDVSAIHDLMLFMDYDDGFVAYINGVEIARA
ncbi:MAG: lamin tail domain-containing protein, partial [Flavobacteriales bacterium]|nr:lamin tail domain-containing protein [Flavobacteriales bacterium]